MFVNQVLSSFLNDVGISVLVAAGLYEHGKVRNGYGSSQYPKAVAKESEQPTAVPNNTNIRSTLSL